jgi:Uncharacterized conserved protein, contains FHA domain
MQFTIVQCNTDVPAKTVAFSPPGGTIGRSQDNDLVLPDESRAISRLQALVHLSPDGECRLTNQGSVTSVVLNGVALQRGSQVRLRHGDTLQIGEYGLKCVTRRVRTHRRMIHWRFLLTAPPIRWVCSRTKACRNRKSCRRVTVRVTNAARTRAWRSIRKAMRP